MKTPRTTTGEMGYALGKLRDFLAALFGDDSADKEAARKTPAIGLATQALKIETESILSGKADKTEVENALADKMDKSELNTLEEAIARRGTPIGSIEYFAMATPPAGYLNADGAAVGRQSCPGTGNGRMDGSNRAASTTPPPPAMSLSHS